MTIFPKEKLTGIDKFIGYMLEEELRYKILLRFYRLVKALDWAGSEFRLDTASSRVRVAFWQGEVLTLTLRADIKASADPFILTITRIKPVKEIYKVSMSITDELNAIPLYVMKHKLDNILVYSEDAMVIAP